MIFFYNTTRLLILVFVIYICHNNNVIADNYNKKTFITELSKLMDNTYQIPNFILCLSKEVVHKMNSENDLDSVNDLYTLNEQKRPISFCNIYTDKLLEDCLHFSLNYTLYSKPCDLFSRIDSEYVMDDQKYLKLFLENAFEKQNEYKNVSEIYEGFIEFNNIF